MAPNRLVLTTVAMFLLAGCAAAGAHPGSSTTPARPPFVPVETPPEPTTGPFVVVAVDNHFHDIHYAERNPISEDRPFVVKNEGRNLHNFTVIGTHISIDIRPGHQFTWTRLGDHLTPGTYQVVCKYHTYVNMGGHFTVTRG
ncbi:MAG: hypothetical protein ACJ77A_18625 [Actinomycetota bacterium]